jgi:transposase
MERWASAAQWNAMDFAHRSAMAGLAQKVWGAGNRASALPELGGPWGYAPNSPRAGRGFAKSRQARSERDVHGRQLFSGQKGGARVGKTKRGKGTKIMAVADAHGLPLALHTEAASPAEVTLAERTIENRHVLAKPFLVVADRAYDSDPLRERMADEDMILIAPHRKGRRRPDFNDGRRMRRYRKRWKIERLFAWLHNFRRLVVRYEYHPQNFHAFLELGAAIILLRHL